MKNYFVFIFKRIFGFNNKFIKSMRAWHIFLKHTKKTNLFIKDYELIHKIYSRY
jgi:hypothetical protein